MKKRIKYTLFLLISVPILLEALLWAFGFRPYEVKDFSIVSDPQFCLVPHSQYGIALKPGKFQVTMNGALTYQVTHSLDSIRETKSSHEKYESDLAVFGCSYTYGIGEDDSLVLTSLLSDEFTNFNIKSYAVPGYGNVHGFLKLQELVSEGKKPKVAIFNFADFHLERNVLSPVYRAHLKIGFERARGSDMASMESASFPFVKNLNGKLTYESIRWLDIYDHWPGRKWSCVVNAVQTAYDNQSGAKLASFESTELLFKEINSFCNSHDIQLVVTGITDHPDTMRLLAQLNEHGINTLDITLPVHQKAFNHWPVDTHPNAVAHKFYADGIAKYLNKHHFLNL